MTINCCIFITVLIATFGLIVVLDNELDGIRVFVLVDVIIALSYIVVNILELLYKRFFEEESSTTHTPPYILWYVFSTIWDIVGFITMSFFNRYFYKGAGLSRAYFYMSFIPKAFTVLVLVIALMAIGIHKTYTHTTKSVESRKRRRQVSSFLRSTPIQQVVDIPTLLTRDQTCSICISDFADDDEIRTLPCSHKFHPDCIDEWLEQSPTCPNCRKNVFQAP